MYPEPALKQLEISENLIQIGLNCQNDEEVIRQLGSLLQSGGYVKDRYVEAVIAREQLMPTGLATKAGGFAIPHTESEHVYRSAIAIGKLDHPVNFKNMASPTEDVPVKFVLLLAITEKKAGTNVLASLAEIFLDAERLNKIQDMHTTNELSSFFSGIIQ